MESQVLALAGFHCQVSTVNSCRLLTDSLPPSGLRRALHCVQHRLVLYSVLEVRRRHRVAFESGEEILESVDESVLVAYDVTGRPPGTNVRVYALGDIDRFEALQSLWVGTVIDFQFVHPFQVKGDAAFAAVNLEGVVVSASTAKARRLENADTPVLEPGEEVGVVVHCHFALGSGSLGSPSP